MHDNLYKVRPYLSGSHFWIYFMQSFACRHPFHCGGSLEIPPTQTFWQTCSTLHSGDRVWQPLACQISRYVCLVPSPFLPWLRSKCNLLGLYRYLRRDILHQMKSQVLSNRLFEQDVAPLRDWKRKKCILILGALPASMPLEEVHCFHLTQCNQQKIHSLSIKMQ